MALPVTVMDTFMKTEVVLYDYGDPDVPVLGKMYKRRLASYKAIGYETKEQS
jgi:hypothetical protein